MKISSDKQAFFHFIAEALLGLAFVSTVIVWINHNDWLEFREKSSDVSMTWKDFHDTVTLPKPQKPNLLILGSSRAKFLNPVTIEEETEYRPQFIGHGGAQIGELYFAFQYVLKHHIPKVVLVETHSLVESGSKGRKELSLPIAMKAVDDFTFSLSVLSAYYEAEQWPVILTGSALLNREFIETKPGRIYDSILGRISEPKPTTHGFQISEYQPITEERLANYEDGWVAGDLQNWVMPAVEINYLTKLVELCRKHSIEVILYESPIYEKHMSGRKIRNQRLTAISKSLQTVFYDFNAEPDITKEPNFFEDTNRQNQHLTFEGCQILSQLIVEKILRILPSH